MSDQTTQYPVSGAGLGLRRPIIKQLMDNPPSDVDFMEVAPENWINVGGRQGKNFRYFTERYPFLIHGLSLSIGSPAPLDEQLVLDIKKFMADHDIRMYSEHLSFCSDDGHLYGPHAHSVYRRCGDLCRRAHSPRAGDPRAAHRDGDVSYYTPTDTSMSEADLRWPYSRKPTAT